MTTHRIDLPPVLPPKTHTVSCTCGGWSDFYTDDAGRRRVHSDALDHVASRCGGQASEVDNTETGGSTFSGEAI